MEYAGQYLMPGVDDDPGDAVRVDEAAAPEQDLREGVSQRLQPAPYLVVTQGSSVRGRQLQGAGKVVKLLVGSLALQHGALQLGHLGRGGLHVTQHVGGRLKGLPHLGEGGGGDGRGVP